MRSTKIVPAVSLFCLICLTDSLAAAEPPRREGCGAGRNGDLVQLRSPAFVFCLNVSSGLRAEWWENRLTGRRVTLGGAELGVDVGLPEGPVETLAWQVTECSVHADDTAGQCVIQLAANRPELAARVSYRWNATEPVLRKLVEIRNAGDRKVDRLLNVRLGDYRIEAEVSGRERGFPVYIDEEFFLSLSHPGGWATAKDGEVSLRHYPGVLLEAGETFSCMETVYGVGEAGGARKTFLTHLRARMRRVVRGHDRPYAIFEPFGARPGNNQFDETESFLLDNLAKVAEGQQQTDCRFDFHSIDFWVDRNGDLKGCDPVRFPRGLAPILGELSKLGIAPGLWIDSSMTHWSIGGNPAVEPTFTHDPRDPAPRVPVMCRATEPIKSMYTEAFRYHIRENGVRLLKFDNLRSICHNPNHDHLAGIYSTEAIQNSVIEFLHALDQECPDVFLMLYWGHRSPWWLLHADTLFDSGVGIEAASPSDFPAPFARDSVTQRLDQAQWFAADVPPLGKDSLGVWLSDWGWNSSIGKERWQEGFVMDLSRGSLLAQPWSDTDWLSPPEREELAELVALPRARPDCFGNSRFILGNPWKQEPYGYCCCDGRRAFLALNNGTWEDHLVTLELNSAWGLPDGQSWDLYRWYPDPARLTGAAEAFGGKVSVSLRPFQVVLLEVVPAGQAPSLDRPFADRPIPVRFAEPSRPVELTVETLADRGQDRSDSGWTVLEPSRCLSARGATLTLQADGSLLAGGPNESPDTYTITAQTREVGITAVRLEVLPDARLPSGGPGRVDNGNFALDEFALTAAPANDPDAAQPVPFGEPLADLSQQSHGGWPVAAALDGDPDTGWSVHPATGCPHVAIVPIRQPIGTPGGTRLIFTLQQGSPKDHNLGRFRLAFTTAEPPFAIPQGYGPKPLVVKGLAPATAAGGMLVVSVQMSRDGKPMAVRDVGRHLRCTGTLGGRPAAWQPVLGEATYPAPWQAWRIAVEPSVDPRPFRLEITAESSSHAESTCRGFFIAK